MIGDTLRIRSNYTTDSISLKNENTNSIFIKKLDKFSSCSVYPDIDNTISSLSSTLNIDQSNLILGAGSEEILKNLFLVLDYDSIQILEYSFELSFYYNRLLNKKIILNNIKFDGNTFSENNIKTLGGDLLYLVSPHCPTGITFSLEQLEEYSKIFRYVIVDEAYINPLNFDLPIIQNVIYVRSFSKLGGVPGLRFGYVVSHENIIQKLNCIRNSYEINTYAVEYLQFISNNVQIIDEALDEYSKCYSNLKNVINEFSICCGNFATFKSEKLNGKKYTINGTVFTRVTLCDSLNYENLYCG
jgi:histidinol-phosphate/aromatic aminotransferase/cobyric acid decarboxylase-like protein